MSNLSQVSECKTTISFYKKSIISLLNNLKFGAITIEDAEGIKTYGNLHEGLHARMLVNNSTAYDAIFWYGGMGLAEGYIAGLWETDNLTTLLRILAHNLQLVDKSDKSTRGLLIRLLANVMHFLNKNNLAGSRRNIAKHYDLGNDFFKLFLDPQMMYSSAIFTDPSNSLEQASLLKLKTICDKLELKPNEHLLEIGSGWGGLAIFAAQNYGCYVTTTTISQEQYNYVLDKITALGLQQQITILKQDYRNLTGLYDKAVSIEMIEAVGHEYFNQYFSQCSKLVKPNGLLLIQAITIADQRYADARDSVDFIKKYIFPGCCIPSMTEIMKNITKYTQYSLLNIQDITLDYARTLKKWHDSFNMQLTHIRSLNFDEHFIRKWQYYFSYCEAGFLERAIFDIQLLFANPEYRPADYATY
jgi:cyclopropane-fatty-acyl-phospholipid synthase